ncbi:MAG TPA: DUF1223 domain-containing protein [Oxalicibacterium sp.]|nr:DUF1223 domain-containing protein [Oxalicibacterium sp.]
MKPLALTVLASALCTTVPSYAGNVCEVKSGPATAALVELYTSEGCSSCPPADRQLSRLNELAPGAAIVPLSLHVTYWDQIGWKDVFAQPRFDDRQSALLAGKPNHVVYTPQFFVSGAELRSRRDNLPNAVRQINARPAPVAITLKTAAIDNGKAALDVDVQSNKAPVAGDLYVALSENDLTSHVLRGENSGATLHHDNTVRLWLGPVALANGSAHLHQEVSLPAAWKRQHLQAVAFVQEPNQGRVLQALSTAQCASTRSL